jgi:hypothetical protein
MEQVDVLAAASSGENAVYSLRSPRSARFFAPLVCVLPPRLCLAAACRMRRGRYFPAARAFLAPRALALKNKTLFAAARRP